MIGLKFFLYIPPHLSFEGECINPEELKAHALILNAHLEEVSFCIGALQDMGWVVDQTLTTESSLVLRHPTIQSKQDIERMLRHLDISENVALVVEGA